MISDFNGNSPVIHQRKRIFIFHDWQNGILDTLYSIERSDRARDHSKTLGMRAGDGRFNPKE